MNPQSYVSHCGSWEMLLIRTGHHLMKQWRRAIKRGSLRDVRALEAALATVWSAKRQFRAEMRRQREAA